jgi:16S rRNA (cytosine967-C5)-methyltransferase
MKVRLSKNKNPRYVALRVLTRVVAGDAYANILLDKELGALEGPDRGLLTELVYGVLRWQIKIDWIIDSFSRIKTKKLEHEVLNALRLGVYQLLFLTKVPPEAAVYETVELLKLDGPSREGTKRFGFVNAVLKMVDSGRAGTVFPALSKEPVNYISVVFSHPPWIVERWIKRYGIKEAIELCQASLKVPPTTLRVNTLRLSRLELLKELGEEGYRVKQTLFSPDGIEVAGGEGGKPPPLDAADPRYYIQDEASQLVSRLLSPGPGETVLDACAGAGGKTTHIAQMMDNRGHVIAMDKHARRLKPLVSTLKRFQVGIVETVVGDAAAPLEFQPSLFPEQSASPTVSTEGFDAVLIDAPCSGLGVLRRKPDIKLKRSEGDIQGLSGLQRSILDNTSKYVKRGGRIVYSVCTFEPEETDTVVEGFLEANADFIFEDASEYLPASSRELVTTEGVLRTFPHRHGTDGFYAVRMRRV